MIRKSLLEVRKRRPTKSPHLALSPHAVDGSNYCGHHLASIDEYISTLHVQSSSGLSFKNVITLGLSAMEMDSLLPLLFFLPREWKEKNLLDALVKRHPDIENLLCGTFAECFTPMALAVLADMALGVPRSDGSSQTLEGDRQDVISDSDTGDVLSPNLGARKKGSHLPADSGFESSSILPMLFSGDNISDPLLPSLPNPFVLSRDLPAIVNKILQVSSESEEGGSSTADVDVKQTQIGSPVNEEIFPGLMWGYHGLKYKQTPREMAVYRVFAAVMNRLCGNSLPPSLRWEVGKSLSPPPPMGADSGSFDNSGAVAAAAASADITSSPFFSLCTSLPEDEENESLPDRFSVMLHPMEKERLESVEDLLKCLSKTHRVDIGIEARTTSFGKHLSFEENGEMVYIPLAIPYKTAIPNIGCGGSTNREPLLSYLPHTYLCVTVEGPIVNASVQAYQGFAEGSTGWFSNTCIDIPWHNGDNVTCKCNSPAYNKKEGLRAARLFSLESVVHNLAAHRKHLKYGGYGSLSSCIGITAAVDMAVRGSTTLYPVLMGSSARILLADTAEELAAAAQSIVDKKDFMKIRSVILSMPSDITTQPQDLEVIYSYF